MSPQDSQPETPKASPRVASLLPSATEIVSLVGAGEQLVGLSHECDWPPAVAAAGLPTLTSSRVSIHRASGEIDRDVRELLKTALAVYEIDVDALERALPDVIVTQDLCDVCAVSYADVERAVETISKEAGRTPPRIVNLHPTKLGDIWRDIEHVGRALGREAEAKLALDALHARIDLVAMRAKDLPRRNVLTIEWIDPVMIGGTWMPELVELCGGEALVTKPGDHAPTLSPEQLRELRPDVVLIKPCGYPLAKTHKELDTLRALFTEFDWPALATGEVWIADGNAYFNRPGPRIVDSLEIMAACVHPEEFGDLAEKYASNFERFAATA